MVKVARSSTRGALKDMAVVDTSEIFVSVRSEKVKSVFAKVSRLNDRDVRARKVTRARGDDT